MRLKTFRSNDLADIEQKVNLWLEENPVALEHMKAEHTPVVVSSNSGMSTFVMHYMVIWYDPLVQVGATGRMGVRA